MNIVYSIRSNKNIFSMYANHFLNKYSHTSSKSISSVNWPWLDEPLFVLPSLSISSCVANSKTLFPRDWIASNLNSIIGLISSKNFVIFCPTIIGRARRNATPKQLTSSSFCISKNSKCYILKCSFVMSIFWNRGAFNPNNANLPRKGCKMETFQIGLQLWLAWMIPWLLLQPPWLRWKLCFRISCGTKWPRYQTRPLVFPSSFQLLFHRIYRLPLSPVIKWIFKFFLFIISR